MATTGELRAIIEELQLVDIGEAASYLGEEEEVVVQESSATSETVLPLIPLPVHGASCVCIYCNW
jgi:hypothetical protein